MKAFITATGAHLPENIITNDQLAAKIGLLPEQIFKSAGIRERRWAAAGESTSDLACRAFTNSETPAETPDYVLFGTMTSDRFIPGSSPAVQTTLGLREIPCLDIRAACCNTLYGLQVARALVMSNVASCVALCLAEVQSAFLKLTPGAGTTSMLFGDGAAVLIVSSEAEEGALEIVDVHLATDGKYVDDLGIRCPGSEFRDNRTNVLGAQASSPAALANRTPDPQHGRREGLRSQHVIEPQDFEPRMVGQSVILQASRRMLSACWLILERNNLSIDDVSWVVPHQANANLLAQLGRGLGLKDTSRIVSVIEYTGNTSSASMGIALDKLRRSGELVSGDYLLMPAFAAGFTWGAGLCRVC